MRIALRSVREPDMEFLYELHNDPTVRKYFHQKKKFTYKQHTNYWKHWLHSRNFGDEFSAKIILVDKVPAGCIRRVKGNISVAVLPKFQSNGVGKKALKRFSIPGDSAEIYFENSSSLRLFNAAGFIPLWIKLKKK